ncbi:MAG: L-histidine N(alpha)-methyltransferase [Sphingobacteriaceae bacterium]
MIKTNIQLNENTQLEAIAPESGFYQDVIRGLAADPKSLDSKYFYDTAGDQLFQAIMHTPEYYPTKCELEIFEQQTTQLVEMLTPDTSGFDLIELGAGNALKSSFLLDGLLKAGKNFTYYPIDISENIIRTLQQALPQKFPDLNIMGLQGEYFEMLEKAYTLSDRKKVILFLGSNIGNMSPEAAESFCVRLRQQMVTGDLLLIGFDLKKNPKVILDAYNDASGMTREFNLNLLNRINKELGANFNLAQFDHYPTYNPQTGACKSYLVSLQQQSVSIVDNTIDFAENEIIDMEISQKFTVDQTDAMAKSAGFKSITHLFDRRKWFLDAIWECI